MKKKKERGCIHVSSSIQRIHIFRNTGAHEKCMNLSRKCYREQRSSYQFNRADQTFVELQRNRDIRFIKSFRSNATSAERSDVRDAERGRERHIERHRTDTRETIIVLTEKRKLQARVIECGVGIPARD